MMMMIITVMRDDYEFDYHNNYNDNNVNDVDDDNDVVSEFYEY